MWQTKVVAYSTPISPHPSQLTAPDLTRYAQCLEEVHPSPSPSSLSSSHDWSKLGCASISLASYSLSLRHVLNIWPKSRVGSLLRAFWERFSSHLKKQKKDIAKKHSLICFYILSHLCGILRIVELWRELTEGNRRKESGGTCSLIAFSSH